MSTGAPGQGLVAYFGYGSLVNRATLRTEYVDAVPARLLGWRRSWCPRPDMAGPAAALLTVSRRVDAGCDGIVVIDRLANLEKVDRREARYRRVRLATGDIVASSPLPDCQIYVYQANDSLPRHPEPPVLLRSYLDAVMQGFLTEHGAAGVSRFVTETDGFDLPVHDDRAAPLYPRAVQLSADEEDLFSRLLASCESAGQVPAGTPRSHPV